MGLATECRYSEFVTYLESKPPSNALGLAVLSLDQALLVLRAPSWSIGVSEHRRDICAISKVIIPTHDRFQLSLGA